MFNVLDKSFIHRSYPKLTYGSIYTIEGGQKDVSSLEGIHMKNLNCNATCSELVLFGHTRLDYFLF